MTKRWLTGGMVWQTMSRKYVDVIWRDAIWTPIHHSCNSSDYASSDRWISIDAKKKNETTKTWAGIYYVLQTSIFWSVFLGFISWNCSPYKCFLSLSSDSFMLFRVEFGHMDIKGVVDCGIDVWSLVKDNQKYVWKILNTTERKTVQNSCYYCLYQKYE